MAGTHHLGSKKCKPSREQIHKKDSWLWVGVDKRMTKRASLRNQRRKLKQSSPDGFG